MSLIDDIKVYSQSNHTIKSTIAKYILDNIDSIETITLEDLAKNTFTSKATIVRFTKDFAYKGWTDFLPALISARAYERNHFSNIDHNLPFSESDSIHDIIQKVLTIEKESLQHTADQIDIGELNNAISLIGNANRIVLIGISPNDYIGSIFARKMLSIGKHIVVSKMGEFGIITSSLKRDDVAILISYSGNNPESESLKFIPQIKENGAKIIGLTSENGHYLRRESDICFTICTKETMYRKIGNYSTEESILFILNMFYSAYFAQNYWSNFAYRSRKLSQFEEKTRGGE